MGKCLFLRKGETHTAPISRILANTLAVGSSVYLMENGTAVEYLVVHQGLPSSMYDASCDGCWLLRKDVHSLRQWHTSKYNDYKNSAINTWLQGDFWTSLGGIEQSAIKQVKIPYVNGDGRSNVAAGANGLSAKIFLLSGYEVGWTTSTDQYFPVDGAKLSYFKSGTGTSADNKRIANLNGSALSWWLRSPYTDNASWAWCVYSDGSISSGNYTNNSRGVRPALVLPSTALFDKNTLILKGVA